uniref:MARVEL domain-containing protein n=1 Tax=Oryzias latipes TaxID=8090 RepID=A0A3P9KYA1_ORYLA
MVSITLSKALPKGKKVFTTFPDVLFFPEFVLGGLVWILLILATIPLEQLGWVMFVSVFCFLGTALFFFIFFFGRHQKRFWPIVDVVYHFLSAVFYLSASIILVQLFKMESNLSLSFKFPIVQVDLGQGSDLHKNMGIAATVASFVATLLYFVHWIFSAIRWKRS